MLDHMQTTTTWISLMAETCRLARSHRCPRVAETCRLALCHQPDSLMAETCRLARSHRCPRVSATYKTGQKNGTEGAINWNEKMQTNMNGGANSTQDIAETGGAPAREIWWRIHKPCTHQPRKRNTPICKAKTKLRQQCSDRIHSRRQWIIKICPEHYTKSLYCRTRWPLGTM